MATELTEAVGCTIRAKGSPSGPPPREARWPGPSWSPTRATMGEAPAQGPSPSTALARAAMPACPEGTIKGVDGPSGFAFDSSGDLWVANGTGTVVEYSRADLATASAVPTVTLSYVAGGLSFDPAGNLWASNNGGSAVVEFAKTALGRSGSPKTGCNYHREGLQPRF
jgi:hypothetical protein